MSLMSLRVQGREMCDIVNEGQNYLSLFQLLLQLEREILYYKDRYICGYETLLVKFTAIFILRFLRIYYYCYN